VSPTREALIDGLDALGVKTLKVQKLLENSTKVQTNAQFGSLEPKRELSAGTRKERPSEDS
jgi:hypothetical protein